MAHHFRWLCCLSLLCASVAVAQSSDQSRASWSPVADRSLTEQERQREIENRRIRWPQPVRLGHSQLAQHEAAGDFAALEFHEIQRAMPMESAGSRDLFVLTPSRSEGDVSMDERIVEPLAHPHAVIRSPKRQKGLSQRVVVQRDSDDFLYTGMANGGQSRTSQETQGVGKKWVPNFHGVDADQTLPAPPIHGKYSKHGKHSLIPQQFSPVEPRSAMIPGAREREVWKQPYSYGHFGGGGGRHWSKHHGYRDRYTEWRFR